MSCLRYATTTSLFLLITSDRTFTFLTNDLLPQSQMLNNITKSNRKTKQLKHFNNCIKDKSKFEVAQARKRWRKCASGVVSYHLGAKPRPIRLPSILLSSSIASEPVKCAVSGVEWARQRKSMPFFSTATSTRQASDFFVFVFFFFLTKFPLI